MSEEIMDELPAPHGLEFKWDLKNLQITTRSVEKTLEPLLVQVGLWSNTPFSDVFQLTDLLCV